MGNFLIKLFIRDHENTSDSAVREKYGKFAGIVGILSNLLLCIIKILAGLFSGSIAIIADGINNLADASSSIITFVGFKLASQPEDEDHPYGHARIEYVTGLVISIVIIIIGIQLFRSSLDKILHPQPLAFSAVTIVILIVSILIKLWQARFNIDIGRKIKSVTLTATAADSRNDVIATSAVLLSVLVCQYTGLQIDGYMGCLVAIFIVWSGIQLVKETSSPLLGEAPDKDMVDSIMKMVNSEPQILGVHDLMVHSYGPGKCFASLHAEVDGEGKLMDVHDMIDKVERNIKEALNINIVIHMDPVSTGDPVLILMRRVVSDALAPLDGVESIHDFRISHTGNRPTILFDAVLSPACTLSEQEILDIAKKAARKVNENYKVIITFDNVYTHLGNEKGSYL